MLVHVRLVSHPCFIRLLNTGLDSETLAICVRLCEQVPDDLEILEMEFMPDFPLIRLLNNFTQGANPEALATIIRELRRESNAIQQNNQQ